MITKTIFSFFFLKSIVKKISAYNIETKYKFVHIKIKILPRYVVQNYSTTIDHQKNINHLLFTKCRSFFRFKQGQRQLSVVQSSINIY